MRESERKNELLPFHPNSTGYIIFNNERERETECVYVSVRERYLKIERKNEASLYHLYSLGYIIFNNERER